MLMKLPAATRNIPCAIPVFGIIYLLIKTLLLVLKIDFQTKASDLGEHVYKEVRTDRFGTHVTEKREPEIHPALATIIVVFLFCAQLFTSDLFGSVVDFISNLDFVYYAGFFAYTSIFILIYAKKHVLEGFMHDEGTDPESKGLSPFFTFSFLIIPILPVLTFLFLDNANVAFAVTLLCIPISVLVLAPLSVAVTLVHGYIKALGKRGSNQILKVFFAVFGVLMLFHFVLF